MDYYKILNLDNNASLKEIEQAYLDLSSFYNPNNNFSKEAYKRYREINKAYLILKEEKQRELYNLTYLKHEENESNIEGISHDYNEFVKSIKKDEDITKFKDIVVDDEFSDYVKISIHVPYLYYLVNSEYLVTYKKKEILEYKGICDTCLGLGKVKSEGKIVYCNDCLSSGKRVVTKEVNVSKYYLIEERIVDKENKVIIEFIYDNKDEYEVTGNTIIYKHIVSEEEYHKGINYVLKNKDNVLNISESEFTNLNQTYVFMDKIIKIEYILKEYEKERKEGYIVSNSNIVYLNPSDFTYNETSSDIYTLKLELSSKQVSFNLANKEYLINVIKLVNEKDKIIFFDREIKKVSANLFKFKGVYNNHYFKNKHFEYDDNYIYIPSKAYKLKNKYYTPFRVIYLSLLFVVPLILFLIFNVSYAFFITSFIFIVVYLIGVNLLMEVKI